MTATKPLFLYEEILLLALGNKTGIACASFPELAMAGAILAELLLRERIVIDDPKKRWVAVRDRRPTGDAILDHSLHLVATAKRRYSLKSWVSRLSSSKKHKVAAQLCEQCILRPVEDKFLFVFSRKTYPEKNPLPEQAIVERMRAAIFDDEASVDPRTTVLISLADAAGLLGKIFGQRPMKDRKRRVKEIVSGEVTGKATKEVIAATKAAIMMAAIIPALVAH